jgi:dTMP kinase
MSGKLITFEGIDGSGKSTQIQMLENEFEKLGVEYKTFREPGGTELSEKIRDILLDKRNIELITTAESLLFAAARAQLTAEKIQPAIIRGIFVICDRFTDSTIAYQGYGRGLDIKKLQEINNIATDGLNPDITFILDINPDVTKIRMDAEALDRMENIGKDFFERVRQGYHRIKEQNPNRCMEINAEQTPEGVFRDIREIIIEKYEEILICS